MSFDFEMELSVRKAPKPCSLNLFIASRIFFLSLPIVRDKVQNSKFVTSYQ